MGEPEQDRLDDPFLYHVHFVGVCLTVAVSGYFPDTNTTFWVFVNSTSVPVNAAVGEASNEYRGFTCYKDDGRLLYKQNGSNFFGIYYCQ